MPFNSTKLPRKCPQCGAEGNPLCELLCQPTPADPVDLAEVEERSNAFFRRPAQSEEDYSV